MMAFVPTPAIHEVEILENNSGLHDEILCARLQLIPVRGDQGAIMTLNVTGPCIVTSNNLAGPQATCIPEILICKLGHGQRLNLRTVIEIGTGFHNAKWAPITTFLYPMELVDVSSYLCAVHLTGSVTGKQLIEKTLELLPPVQHPVKYYFSA